KGIPSAAANGRSGKGKHSAHPSRGAPAVPGHGRPEPASATDQCVADKLRAAASYCSAAIGHGASRRSTQHLARARDGLARSWRRAEAKAAAAGAACAETTVDAQGMIDLLDAGAASFADADRKSVG